MHSITCRYHFDYGHRVHNHEGKCRRLHGHRATVEVTIGTTDNSLDDVGRVLDFGEVKSRIGQWIDDNWDHRTILCLEDDLLTVVRTGGGGPINTDEVYIMPEGMNTTAEHLAQHLFAEARDMLTTGVLRVLSVRFWETPNNCAEYRPH